MAMLYGRTAQREETDVKLHEFTRSANGRVIRLNPEQISEMQAHPTENGVTVIWMGSVASVAPSVRDVGLFSIFSMQMSGSG
jgi:hypothetical protein